MPLYEYQCQQCGTRSEVLQKLADAPLTVCEVCGGALKRLVSAPAVQFKGAGWYVTDYARKSGTPAKGEGTSGEKSGGADSKPAASETKSDKGSSAASSSGSPASGGGSGKSD